MKKEYFFCKQTNKWLCFVWQNSGDKIFFAWWNEIEPKFIIKSLVKEFGKEEWIEIYKKFCTALANVDKNIISPHDKYPTAALVKYKKTNDYKNKERRKNKEKI